MTRPFGNAHWSLGDIQLGTLMTQDTYDDDGLQLHRVIGIITDPVMVLRPVNDDTDGQDDLHLVIGSPLAAEWRRVELVDAGGSTQHGTGQP